MKGIVFLCLIKAISSSSEGKYTWDSTEWSYGDDNSLDSSQETDDAVRPTDNTLCGCCLMEKQINRTRMFFDMTSGKLQESLMKVKNILNNVRASRSAFSAALNTTTCLGPFDKDMTVLYTHIFINMGDGYDVDHGKFTAPRSGVYVFALTVSSDASVPGAPSNQLAICASVQVNGQKVAEVGEKNDNDQADSASVALAVELKAQDEVAVILHAGCFLCDQNHHYNTFTGYLVYATDV